MKRPPLALTTGVVAAISCAALASSAVSFVDYGGRLDRPAWSDWLIDRTGVTPLGSNISLERYATIAAVIAALAFALEMMIRWCCRPGRRIEAE